MSDLQFKRCLACEGQTQPLPSEEIKKLLTQIPLWKCNGEVTQIYRNFSFKNFYQTMAFVNAVAWIANQENHHPDMEIGYNYCLLKYNTHAVGGLTENDFICASKIDALDTK